MTQLIDPSQYAGSSKFDSFKNDSKTTGSITIPSLSYAYRAVRSYSFDIPMANTLSPTQVYLNWGFEPSVWQSLNTTTFINHPQNFEIAVYATYSSSAITVRMDITNRNNPGPTVLSSFTCTGNAYFFIAPW
mgnify:CR=1 FL=1